MPAKAPPIPFGHRTATPYLVVRDAGEAIDFYTRAFGAKEVMRVESRGRIGHAQIRIGNSRIMVSDEHQETGALSPTSTGGSPEQYKHPCLIGDLAFRGSVPVVREVG